MSIKILTHLVPLLLLVLVAGCTEPTTSNSKSDTESAKVATTPINSNCPIAGEEVDPDVSVQWKGQTVAFCCADCIPDWNKLSDDEKQSKLDAASQDDHSGHDHSEHEGHGK